MNLSDQVCSLDLAKRLKEFGVKQESLYEWVEHSPQWNKLNPMWAIFPVDVDDNVNEKVATFTVAELGEMLPNYFKHEDHGYINLRCLKLDNGGWEILYYSRDELVFVERADTEADARSKMLIYLLEKKLISL